MNRFFLRSVGAIAILAFFLAALSCAHDQQLVGIEIQPGTETFGASNIPIPADAGLSVQLKAFGHYIHPPVTKDITNQVAWLSNTPGLATVDQTGLLQAAGQDCGTGLVFASVTNNTSAGNRTSTGAEVKAQMTVNVVCFTGASGNNALLTVEVIPQGDGTIGISAPNTTSQFCSGNCTVSFPIGTGPITLTAAANLGHTFTGWTNCAMQDQQGDCIIQQLSTDLTVDGNFK